MVAEKIMKEKTAQAAAKKPTKKPTKKTAKKTAAKTEKKLTKRQKLLAFQADVNQRYGGSGRLKRASEYVVPYYLRRLPSGIIDLDIATGGGLPAGGLTEIIGPEGSCKSWLLIQYMKRQQEIFGNDFAGAMAMTEMHFDKLFARMFGLKIAYHNDEIAHMNKLREEAGQPSFNKEEMADLRDEVGFFFEVLANSAESLYDMILDMIYSRLYNLIGIDSWGALLTKEEEGKTMAQKTRGGSAKVNTEWIRRFANAMNNEDPETGLPNMTTVIGINQFREKMNHQGGMSITGGHALKHGKFVSIFVRAGSPIFAAPGGKFTIGKGEDAKSNKYPQIGKVIHWSIIKGKAGCHDGPTGNFLYFFETGADLERQLVIAAQKCAAIETSGSWLSFGDVKLQGVDNFADALREDAQLRAELEEAVFLEHDLQPNFT